MWSYSYVDVEATKGNAQETADINEFETYYKSELEDEGVVIYPALGGTDILGAIPGNRLGVDPASGDQDYRTLVWQERSWAYGREACQVNIENPWLSQLYIDLKQTIATIDSARNLNRGSQFNSLEPELSSVEREWKRQAIAGYPGFTLSDNNIGLSQPAKDAVDAVVAAIKANDSGSLAALKLWKQLIINLFIDCTRYCKGETIPHYAAPGGTLTILQPFAKVTHYLNPGVDLTNSLGIPYGELQQNPGSDDTPTAERDYFFLDYQSHSQWSLESAQKTMGSVRQPNGVESIEWRSYFDRLGAGTPPNFNVPAGTRLSGGYTSLGTYATSRYGTKFGALPYLAYSQNGADYFGSTAYLFNPLDPALKEYVDSYMTRRTYKKVQGSTGIPYDPVDTLIDHDACLYWWKKTLRGLYSGIVEGMVASNQFIPPSHIHLTAPLTIAEGATSVWYTVNHIWGNLPDPEFYADIVASSYVVNPDDRTTYVSPAVWYWGTVEYRRVRLVFLTSTTSSNVKGTNCGRQWAERQLFGKPYIDTANNEHNLIGKLDEVNGPTSADHDAFFQNAQFGDSYWSTQIAAGSQLPWWTPSGGNQGPLASLKQLDDPTHPLYPYLSGEHGHGTVNVYNAEIRAPQIREAVKHYCTHWQIKHMKAIRAKLKDLYR